MEETVQARLASLLFHRLISEGSKLKFQMVAEKTAKNFRGLLYFAAVHLAGLASLLLHRLISEGSICAKVYRV